ncbi:molybdenum ABC transporter ATP-binding protein [Nitrospina watsonii]|uniref:Molybdate ABC transporter ATP binding subunit n=1 Tax=Nitrospina watsonii TaxID=1323948 RepID=A0ABN8VYU5_9BACT|nr:molybdenum ABC transporter ATP-binding protein [Nitrospina watsonii]CAI2717278.1 molybdate ABC transporter ATP binding subunit [Nitrospina watsonii]
MSRLTAQFHIPYPGFELNAELDVPAHGVTVIFGRSGSGKTTLLRCMAGLTRSPSGYFRIGDAVWQDESTGRFRPVHQRAIGLVFQDARLFPHLTVQGNLHYGYRRIAEHERRIDFDHIVSLLELAPLLNRMPRNLSGGEQQRVAIGRALLTSPRLLLMDEPLANLDTARKLEILPFLLKLRTELGLPIVYVSHSLEEILQLVDTLVLLKAGRVIACGPAQQVLTDLPPGERIDPGLAGTLLDTTVVDHDDAFALTRVRYGDQFLYLPKQKVEAGRPLRLHILARDISLVVSPASTQTSVLNILEATVVEVLPRGPAAHAVDIKIDIGQPVLATITRKSLARLELKPGQKVYAHIKAVQMVHELPEF